MQTFNTITDLQNAVNAWKIQGKIIGFVPTMGGLHMGHISLVEKIQQQVDIVVVSIFVNPAQFGKNEDFNNYPNTLNLDLALLKTHNVDVVFTPSTQQIYPNNFVSNIKAGSLAKGLCAKSRPKHFDGVVQVVHRLFDIVSPDVAIFGQKDYQQLLVIKQMVEALALPIKILSGAIVRENDGLAMSTRNQYLTTKERELAPKLQQILIQFKNNILSGGICAKSFIEMKKYFKIDYLSVLDANTLKPITDNTVQIAILCAVFLGSTRLIDNIIFTQNKTQNQG
jgi:pantoate--beta-alanine ligase